MSDRALAYNPIRATIRACEHITAYLGVAFELPSFVTIRSEKQLLTAISETSGLELRRVRLRGEWWKEDNGALLAHRADGHPIALIPDASGGYTLIEGDRRVTVDGQNALQVKETAFAFFRALPEAGITARELFGILTMIVRGDPLLMILLALAGGVSGLLIPLTLATLFNPIDQTLLILVLCFVFTLIAQGVYTLVRTVVITRITQRIDRALPLAIWERLAKLPAPFFRRYHTERPLQLAMIRMTARTFLLITFGLTAGLTLLFYQPWLTLIAIGTIGAMLIVTYLITRRYLLRPEIKLTIPAFVSTLARLLPMIGTGVMLLMAWSLNAITATMIPFIWGVALIAAASLQFSGTLISWAALRPVYERIQPLLRLRGAMSMDRVTFSDQGTPIVSEISLQIPAGGLVALVGASGSGKSTVIRLLMGFERPQSGTIRYDDQPLDHLDLRVVRQQIGLASQQETIEARTVREYLHAGESAIWEALEIVKLTDTIRLLGLDAPLEGNKLSLDQRQRLQVARVLSQNPAILILDEPLPALSDQDQTLINAEIAKLKMTRILVSQRLHTVLQADRIFMLHEGRIVEQGNYGELIAARGHFAKLATRQRPFR
ncbi:MAG: ATP-binding cassette domain-containing protein [Anaerolineae bacterium]|nr:ATP-binding cassette domain-containing protein [Anaerolineae bacterium]